MPQLPQSWMRAEDRRVNEERKGRQTESGQRRRERGGEERSGKGVVRRGEERKKKGKKWARQGKNEDHFTLQVLHTFLPVLLSISSGHLGQLTPSHGMRPLLLVCSTLSPLQHEGSGDHVVQGSQENSAFKCKVQQRLYPKLHACHNRQ